MAPLFEKHIEKMSIRELRIECKRLREAARCIHEQMSMENDDEHQGVTVYRCGKCGHRWSD